MKLTAWRRRAVATLIGLASCAVTGPAPAAAQSFPTKAITLIVPFAAGGPSDTTARLVADHMSRTLGQQIVIENVGGAGGTIGAERAARATPDGYTILLHHGALPASMALYTNLKFDAATAYETLGLINTGPMALTSRKSLEVKDAAALSAWLKEQGAKATVAHAGVGSNSYMCAVLLMQVLDIKPSLVPYRGTGPAMNDLVAGQIDVLCDQATTATPQILAGTIKAYAVSSSDRLAALKDVPSAVEAGLKGLDMAIWNGLYAPKGTPKEATEKLHEALQKFVDDSKTLERFEQTGTVAFPKDRRSMTAHDAYLKSEIARYKKLVEAAGLKPGEAK